MQIKWDYKRKEKSNEYNICSCYGILWDKMQTSEVHSSNEGEV
jgi:hypothetical protein